MFILQTAVAIFAVWSLWKFWRAIYKGVKEGRKEAQDLERLDREKSRRTDKN